MESPNVDLAQQQAGKTVEDIGIVSEDGRNLTLSECGARYSYLKKGVGPAFALQSRKSNEDAVGH